MTVTETAEKAAKTETENITPAEGRPETNASADANASAKTETPAVTKASAEANAPVDTKASAEANAPADTKASAEANSPADTATAAAANIEGARIALEDVAALLLAPRRTLVLTHARPDGDAVGSASALVIALRLAGHDCRALCADEVPRRLGFIGGGNVDFSAGTLEADYSPELIVSVDTAETHLLGDAPSQAVSGFFGRVDVKIDHHGMGSLYAAKNYIDENAAAAGEIIYRLLRIMEKLAPDKAPFIRRETAEPIYAAILSDTGSFRYRGASAETHRIAAELIDAGADHARIADELYGKRSRSELAALKLALESLSFSRGGRIAMIFITNEMKNAAGLSDADLGELNSFPRDILGVDIGITMKQNTDEPDKFRVSVRSSETADASTVCAALGGGGHKRASGALVTADSPEKAAGIVLKAAEDYLDTIPEDTLRTPEDRPEDIAEDKPEGDPERTPKGEKDGNGDI